MSLLRTAAAIRQAAPGPFRDNLGWLLWWVSYSLWFSLRLLDQVFTPYGRLQQLWGCWLFNNADIQTRLNHSCWSRTFCFFTSSCFLRFSDSHLCQVADQSGIAYSSESGWIIHCAWSNQWSKSTLIIWMVTVPYVEFRLRTWSNCFSTTGAVDDLFGYDMSMTDSSLTDISQNGHQSD